MTPLLPIAAALSMTLAGSTVGWALGNAAVEPHTVVVTEQVTAPPKTVRVTETRTVERASRSRSTRPGTSDAVIVRESSRSAIWKRIAECESGGRLHAVSPSGTYLGLYQLHRGFFTTHGYRGDAWKSLTAAEQLRIAEYVQARQGWKAWPVCSKRAGVR